MCHVVSSVCLLLGMASLAAAQPVILTPSAVVVVPGQSVQANVTGPSGHAVAVIGSPVGSGLSHAGVSLSVGTDFVVLGFGTLSGGQAVFTLSAAVVRA